MFIEPDRGIVPISETVGNKSGVSTVRQQLLRFDGHSADVAHHNVPLLVVTKPRPGLEVRGLTRALFHQLLGGNLKWKSG